MITNEITTKLGIKTLPEAQNPKRDMFDTGGIEAQVGEFLYGLVRMMRPQYVIETGTYSGISAMYMALGLRDNKFGYLDTIEYEESHYKRAKERFIKLELQNIIIQHHCSSFDYIFHHNYDLMFLDTEPSSRFKELVQYFPRLNPGGRIFIHDAPRDLTQGNVNPDHPEFKSWPFGDLPQEIINWVKDRELVPWHFGTPRGFVGFYKPREDDYKWM